MFRSHEPRPAAIVVLFAVVLLSLPAAGVAEEAWLQLKYDGGRCGNVPDRTLAASLGLIAPMPLTDAVLTALVVAEGRVYVVDAAGMAFCFDAATLRVVWKVATRGGPANTSNVSSPAIAGPYLHFGTTAGSYYVLEQESGKVVREMPCGDPIFSPPVVNNDRVYIATLGSRLYALQPDGTVCWSWDFVKEQLGFDGDRWSGKDWVRHLGERVDFDDQFCCSRNWPCTGRRSLCPPGRGWCGWKISATAAKFGPRTVVAGANPSGSPPWA